MGLSLKQTQRIAGTAVIVLLLAARQSTYASPPAKLTAMDYVEIEQLVNRMNFALDYCINGGRDFAELFIEGGRYLVDEGDGNPRVFDTPEKLAQLAGGPDCKAILSPPRSYVLHLAQGLVIRPSATGATGTSYAIYPARKGKYLKDEVAGQVGLYHDEYVKGPQGWRFRLRRHEVSPPAGTNPLDN